MGIGSILRGKKMKIAICDDNINDINMIKKEVELICGKNDIPYEIATYDDSKDMSEDILNCGTEVVLLDIEMPHLSGLEIADKLKAAAPFINVIFLTNRDDMVFESLRYAPFRFIRKEYMKEELAEALTSVEKKIASEIYFVHFAKDKNAESFQIKEIEYIESRKHYIELHVRGAVHRIRGKISECEKQLADYGFIRIHVGYLVNVRFISCLTSKEVSMDNGEILPVSRKKIDTVKEQYAKSMEKYVNGRYI